MARVYGDISEAVNKMKFEIRVPDSYTPIIPGYYKKFPNRSPFFQENQPFSYTKMTCADIVDLCNSGIQFVIIRREDVEIITNMISRYVSKLSELTQGMNENSDPVIQVGRCNVALNILQAHKTRAIKERTSNMQDKGGETLQSILNKVKW